MGTTPDLNLRYPEPEDTPNVPRDIKNLADDTEAAIEASGVDDVADLISADPGNALLKSAGDGLLFVQAAPKVTGLTAAVGLDAVQLSWDA